MIPTPDEIQSLHSHIQRINYILIREHTGQKVIIKFTEEEGGIPSEHLRLIIADMYMQRGWFTETGQGETSGEYKIELTPKTTE